LVTSSKLGAANSIFQLLTYGTSFYRTLVLHCRSQSSDSVKTFLFCQLYPYLSFATYNDVVLEIMLTI